LLQLVCPLSQVLDMLLAVDQQVVSISAALQRQEVWGQLLLQQLYASLTLIKVRSACNSQQL
jgi:hypothetical protein